MFAPQVPPCLSEHLFSNTVKGDIWKHDAQGLGVLLSE